MPTFITQFEHAIASLSAGVGGYVDFLWLHFGTYAAPRSATELLLFLIAGIVLTQMIRIAKSLARVRALPADVEAEMARLHQQIDHLSRTIAVLQIDHPVTKRDNRPADMVAAGGRG